MDGKKIELMMTNARITPGTIMFGCKVKDKGQDRDLSLHLPKTMLLEKFGTLDLAKIKVTVEVE